MRIHQLSQLDSSELDRTFMIAVLALLAFALIPVIMIARVVIAIIREGIRNRRAEARRVYHTLSELGSFTSTDRKFWEGTVNGVLVLLETTGDPPTPAHADLVCNLLAKMPALVEQADVLLRSDEDCAWLTQHEPDVFEPYALVPTDESTFVLELTHPADLDGVYRVHFRSGVPTEWGRDD